MNQLNKSTKGTIKVLHVINSLAAGGAEKLVSELSTALSDKCDVSLFSFQNAENIFQDNLGSDVTFYGIENSGFFNLKKMLQLSKLIKKHDVIHTHLFPAFYIVAFLSIFHRKKILIHTEHNTHNKRRKSIYWLLEKWVYSRYDSIICISEGVKNSLHDWMGKSVETHVISNFIDLTKTNNKGKRALDQPKLQGKVPLVMVGSFSEQKDQETIINALSVLPEKYILLLIGDGPRRPRLEEQVKNLSLLERVYFFGIQKEVIPILKNCKYGVLSSHWEGFGIVALEYMASGLITLGTNVSGLNEVIPNAKNLFTVGDYKKLANRILEIENDATLAETIRLQQNRFVQNFDIAYSTTKHIELYMSKTKN